MIVDGTPFRKTVQSVYHSSRTANTPTHRAFYQGISPNIAGNSLSWGLYFLWYTLIKQWMLENSPDSTEHLSAGKHLSAAAEAGMMTAFMTNPIWVIKTRMCLQEVGNRSYTGLGGTKRKYYYL